MVPADDFQKVQPYTIQAKPYTMCHVVSFFRIPSISAGHEEHRIAIRGFLTTKSPECLDITIIELVESTFSLEIRLFLLGEKPERISYGRKE